MKDLIESNTVTDKASQKLSAEKAIETFMKSAQLETRIDLQLQFEERKAKIIEKLQNVEGWKLACSSKKHGIAVYTQKEEVPFNSTNKNI